eukprot:m.194271 g.194271  ORF g.194271 m.194271 type:complete len:815 (+) comp32518_c5_seq1:283-2727(+)
MMATSWKLALFCVTTSIVISVKSTTASASSAPTPSKPNIIYFMVDDLGYANVGFHNEEPITPIIDGLHATGIEIMNFYTYHVCSPTRSSFLTGRLPIHVNQLNHNVSFAGGAIPLGMTTLADKLRSVGYSTHQLGKWHLGMSGYDRLPIANGFDTSFGYLGGNEDHYLQTHKGKVDFWRNWNPAHNENGTGYGMDLFTQEMLEIIADHDTLSPLFIYMAFQNVHWPLQAPKKFTELYSTDMPWRRRLCLAMVSAVDWSIGETVLLLKQRAMYDNTLLIFSSDNGGTYHGNNYPFRGTKGSDFEGGVRAVAFISGGMIPEAVRGTQRDNGMMHICDWYATLAPLAGYAAEDTEAARNNLPPIDSLDVWPWLMAEQSQSRDEVLLSANTFKFENDNEEPNYCYGLIMTINGSWFKVIGGEQASGNLFPGPFMPNASQSNNQRQVIDCTGGCLFNLTADPTEHIDLSSDNDYTHILTIMNMRYREYLATLYQSYWVEADEALCIETADNVHKGFWGPFLPNASLSSVPDVPVKVEDSTLPDCICQDKWFYNQKSCNAGHGSHLIGGVKQMSGCPYIGQLDACDDATLTQSWCATTQPMCKQQSTSDLFNTSRAYCSPETQQTELPQCTCKSQWILEEEECAESPLIVNGCASAGDMRMCYGSDYNVEGHESWCRTNELSCLEQSDIVIGTQTVDLMVGQGWSYCDAIQGDTHIRYQTKPNSQRSIAFDDVVIPMSFAILFITSAVGLIIVAVVKRRRAHLKRSQMATEYFTLVQRNRSRQRRHVDEKIYDHIEVAGEDEREYLTPFDLDAFETVHLE